MSQTIADAFPQRNGNGPAKAIAAAEPIYRKGDLTIEASDIHTYETGESTGTKQGAQGWKSKTMLAARVAMVCALSLVGGMLVAILELPDTTKPSLQERAIPDNGAAEQPQSADALPHSAASRAVSDPQGDRSEVNSAAVDAAAGAPRAADTEAVESIQPSGGLSREAPTASIVSTPDAARPPTPPTAQSSKIEPVPTVSPQPAPIASPISPAAIPTNSSSEGQAPQPNTKPTGNGHELGTTNPSAPRHDVPTKVVGKPSTREVGTKNDATRPRVAVRTPAKHHNSAEPKAAQSDLKSSAATPAATNQLNGIY